VNSAGKKFIVRKDSDTTKQIAKDLLSEGNPSAAYRNSALGIFLKYCKVNEYDPVSPEAFVNYIAARIEQEFAYSGIHSTMRAIRRARRKLNLENIAMLALQLRATKYRGNHARDLDEDSVLAILDSMVEAGLLEEGLVAYIMWATGFRFETLREILWGDIRIADGLLKIDVSKAKNLRCPGHQTVWSLSLDAVPAGPLALTDLFSERVGPAAQLLDTPVAFFDLDQLNKAIQHVAAHRTDITVGDGVGADRAPTSYTFRRAAFHRFMEWFRDERGVVDWAQLCLITLHHSADALKAYYAKRASDERLAHLINRRVREKRQQAATEIQSQDQVPLYVDETEEETEAQ
jgi:hypothetical protein